MNYKTIKVGDNPVRVFEDGEIWKITYGEWSRAMQRPNKGYWQVTVRSDTFMSHRLIAMAWVRGYRADLQVHHINGNGFDNSPENLTMMSRTENCRSICRTMKGASSKFRVVTWSKRWNKWHTTIRGKYVGYFKEEIQAAIAYDEAAKAIGWPKSGLNELKIKEELVCADSEPSPIK